MANKHHIPLIVIAILAVLVGVQTFLAQNTEPDAPELYQSQVAKPGNSLENLTEFALDIELKDEHEVKVRYLAGKDDQIASVRRTDQMGEQEQMADQEQITSLLGSIPELTSNQPLTLIKGVLDQLQIHEKDVLDFELKYELKDGTTGNIELEVDKAEQKEKLRDEPDTKDEEKGEDMAESTNQS